MGIFQSIISAAEVFEEDLIGEAAEVEGAVEVDAEVEGAAEVEDAEVEDAEVEVEDAVEDADEDADEDAVEVEDADEDADEDDEDAKDLVNEVESFAETRVFGVNLVLDDVYTIPRDISHALELYNKINEIIEAEFVSRTFSFNDLSELSRIHTVSLYLLSTDNQVNIDMVEYMEETLLKLSSVINDAEIETFG